MSKWYYLLKGKAQGPVTENQIRELLREHQLTLNDIVFREGENKWKRISEFTDINFAQEAVGETNLQQLIKLPTKNDRNDPEKWVVLLKIQTDTEIKFVQKGSWTTTEVKSAIQRGEVSYSDHVWRSGFTKWERIGDLDEFSFKGETQIFSITTPPPPGKIKLTEELLRPRATSKENPISEEVPKDSFIDGDDKKTAVLEKTEVINTSSVKANSDDDFTEKTAMAFSLKLDKSRISDLIDKVSQEADQRTQNKFDDRTVIATNPSVKIEKVEKKEKLESLATVKIPDKTSSIPKMPGATGSIPQPPKATNLVFDDEEDENRKEPSVWLATNKTRSQVMTSKTKTKESPLRRRKKKFWNTVFQFTQIILVLVIVSLVAATLQNLKRRHKKSEHTAVVEPSNEKAATPQQPKKRKTANEEPVVTAPPAPESKDVKEETLDEEVSTETVDAPNIIEEFIELASKPPAEDKSLPPIKPRTSTPFVKIKPLEINSRNPKLRFSSNANEGEAIKFSIRGLTGEILDKPSFKVERSITRRRGKEPEVSLRDLGVTAGYFTVEAELAGAKSMLSHIFVGSKKNFEADVRDYRKEVAYRQQWEKKSLVRIAGDLSGLTQEIFEKYNELDSSKEWQEFFSDWRRRIKETDSSEMRSINSRNQNEYTYPDVWIDLKSLRQKIVSEADEMNSAFLASRRTASSPNKKLLEEASDLANRAGDLSGWRQKSAK